MKEARCLRCQAELKEVGSFALRNEPLFSLELWERILSTSVLRCESCGHLEFFDARLLGTWFESERVSEEFDVQVLPGGEDLPPEEPY